MSDKITAHTSAVSLHGVKFSYIDSSNNLDHTEFVINLDVLQGRRIAIVGPSGSGKSTILKLISGEHVANEGLVEVLGTKYLALKSDQMSQFRLQRISQIFQELELLPSLSSIQNASLLGELRGCSTKETRLRANKILKALGLGEKLRKKPNQLSGGERQRVAIARAIVAQSPLVLADEPTAALDKETKSAVLDLLFGESPDSTYIFSTHDEYLMSQCDEVIEINQILKRSRG